MMRRPRPERGVRPVPPCILSRDGASSRTGCERTDESVSLPPGDRAPAQRGCAPRPRRRSRSGSPPAGSRAPGTCAGTSGTALEVRRRLIAEAKAGHNGGDRSLADSAHRQPVITWLRKRRRRWPRSGSHRLLAGGRYWDRTSDLFGVNEARSRCANRPLPQ
jgi:hypothetical protein